MTSHPLDPPKSITNLVRPGTVFLSYRGSESHGTTLPPEDEFGTDDVDLMGAFVHPLEHYFEAAGEAGPRGCRGAARRYPGGALRGFVGASKP